MKTQPSQWRQAGVEFLTIVVGVLVALAFDSWAANLGEHSLEKDYLNRLTADLRADTAELGHISRLWQLYERSGFTVLETAQNGSVEPTDAKTLIPAIVLTGFTTLPSIEGATYDELKSAGLLRLLRDSGVRRALLRYHAQLAFGDPFIERSSSEFRTYVQRRIPASLVRQVGRECRSPDGTAKACSPEDPQFDANSFVEALLRDTVAVGALNIRVSEVIRTREIMEARLAAAMETLSILEAAQR